MKNLAKTLIAVTFCIMLGSFTQAKAVVLTTTLNFEGLTTESTIDFSDLSFNYGGFNWNSGFGLIRNDYDSNSSYDIGVTSGKYAAFDLFGGVASVYKLEGDFNFISANLTSAFVDNNIITVEGYSGKTILYTQNVTLSNSVAQNVQFNFNNIDRLVFKTNLPEGEDSSEFYFAMDDFKYSTVPTPEPSSLVLGFLSLSGLLGIRRKK